MLLDKKQLMFQCAGLFVTCCLSANVFATDDHAHHAATMTSQAKPENSAVRIDLASEILIDHDGATVKFGDGFAADSLLVINFAYTSCTTVCPITSQIMARVQQQLPADLASKTKLLTISVDPVRDTPARLADYRNKLQAGHSWHWLTGEKTAIDNVLRGLGAYTPEFANHPNMFLVGDVKNNQWSRLYGFTSPDLILSKLQHLAHNRDAMAMMQKHKHQE